MTEVDGMTSADSALATLTERAAGLNAITVTTEERARALAARSAERAAAGQPDRPLEGVAVAVKDVIDIEGYPTSMGSAVDTGRGPLTTASVVTSLEAAGALTVAKTNCQEFSYGILGEESVFGPVVNPRGADLCTAGSSSGSTALVAAGAVPLAVGTDTAGSVRIPAACTGTIGFKPTFGLVPVEGVFPLAASCDTVGFFSLDADLLRRAFLATREQDPQSPSAGTGGVPIPPGRSAGAGSESDAEAGAGSACVLTPGEDSAAGRLLAEVVEETLRLYEVLRKYEAYAVHREFLETQPDKYQPVVRQRALLGAEITQSQYEDARAGQLAVRESALRLFDDARLIRTPAIDGVVPRWADLGPQHRDALTRWSTPFNVLGWPAITVPVAGDGVVSVGGAGSGTELRAGVVTRATTLPASVQFAAPPGEDLALLAAVEEFLAG